MFPEFECPVFRSLLYTNRDFSHNAGSKLTFLLLDGLELFPEDLVFLGFVAIQLQESKQKINII